MKTELIHSLKPTHSGPTTELNFGWHATFSTYWATPSGTTS
jgi:hypothetical protein